MLLIPLLLSSALFLGLVVNICEVAESRRLAELVARLPELSAEEFELLLVGLTLPDGVLPPPTVPTVQRQTALRTWLEANL